MTRAQELRKLRLEVEAGEWDAWPVAATLLRIIRVLSKGTGNYTTCQKIWQARFKQAIGKEINNATSTG